MNDYQKNAIKYIDENAGIFTGVSDAVWARPELSLKEFESAKLYCDTLRKYGFEVTEGLAGVATAFCGRYGSGRPVIGILGEFDALSGLSQAAGCAEHSPLVEGGPGHGCGHNMLGAGALGAAFAVKDFLEKTGHSGTVIFYGCPGEEGGAGKAFMAREGLWKELDCALTWHPSDVNEVVTGTNNSSIQVLYRFHGVSAHAAGDPENGRSALDAVELMNTGAQYLREHMTSDCRVHYAIIDAGGVSPNVVQSEASVLYMVRANKVRDSVKLLARVDKIAQGAALMTETSFDRQFIDGTAELVPNYTLERLLYRIFNEVGLPEYSAEEKALAEALRKTYDVGTAPGIAAGMDADIAAEVTERTHGLADSLCGFIMPEYHSAGFVAGSTDVGDVSWQTPAAQVHCVTFAFGAAGHSWQNVSCGGTSLGHKGLINAAKVLACAAIELMDAPDTLAEARAEFEKRTRGGYVCPIEPDAVPTAI